MIRLPLTAALCVALALVPSASAQSESALGRPLITSDVPERAVRVRVVRGDIDKPVAGVDVTLVSKSGEILKARSDSSGRALFPNLEVGGTYRARVGDGEGAVKSQEFEMPKEGGVALLLSVAAASSSRFGDGGAPPLGDDSQGSQGGQAPAMPPHGAGGPGAAADGIPPMMRDPRRISGQPRPETKDPPGQLTVRAVQGKFKSSEAGLTAPFPKGGVMHAVGYHPGGRVSVTSVAIDQTGRAVFKNLERGSAAYYVVALYPRGERTDRLVSQPVRLLPGVGMRMLLAGADPRSPEPSVDDLPAREQSPTQPGPGVVQVTVQAAQDRVQQLSEVKTFELVDAATGNVVAKAGAESFRPSASDVTGKILPIDGKEMQLSPGQLAVGVFQSSAGRPIAGVPIVVEKRVAAPEGTPPPEGEAAAPEYEQFLTGSTDRGGRILFASPTWEPNAFYRVIATVHGKRIVGQPFTAPKEGEGIGRVAAVDWTQGLIQGRFSGVAGGADKIYFARMSVGGRAHLTIPFQLTSELGAAVSMLVYDEILFGFHGGAVMEDDKLWFQLRLLLQNPGQIPYSPTDGLLMPLPEGAIAPSVPEEMTGRVKITDKGLVWRGAVPPGMSDVVVDFAIPVEQGRADINWEMPHGLARGQLMITEVPGMQIAGVKGAPPRSTEMRDGRRYRVFDTLTFARGEQFSFSVRGLPARPRWHAWMRILAGVTALGLFAWAIAATLQRRRRELSSEEQRLRNQKDALLDELASLEGSEEEIDDGDYSRRRERLVKQLEEIFSRLGEGSA